MKAVSREGRPISLRLSRTLDAARAVAACYVLLHHTVNAWMAPRDPIVPMRFGQEAVLVFFLLSGFVIFANERDRALQPRGYYLRRARKIYPPLLLAIALSTAVALAQGAFDVLFNPRQLLVTLLGLQDITRLKPGVIADPYMLNDPLWSLSYEILFYLIFPLVLRAWTAHRARTEHVIGLGCCLLYLLYAVRPGHFQLVGAYFLVWWCGAMAACAWQEGGRSVLAMRRSYLWLLALCVLAAVVVRWRGYTGLGYYPFLPLRHFVAGAAMLALFFGPIGRVCARFLERVGSWPGRVAAISYGIYVLHYPLLVQWHFAMTVPGLIVALALVVTLSYLAERIVPRYLPKAPAT